MSSTGSVANQTAAGQTDNGVVPSAILMLRRVFRILRGCGISTTQIEALSARALVDLQALPSIPLGKISAQQTLACCDLVLKWRRDCRFLDADGQPRPLSIGGASSEFAKLIALATRDADPNGLLQIMIELGVAHMPDSSTVELISDSVVACSGKEGSTIASEIVLEHVCGFLGSVEYNLFEKPSRAKGKFERACYAWVPRQHVPILEQMVSNRGQDFVDVIDEWLARRASATTAEDKSVLVGAGAYVFVRDRLGS